MNDVMKIVKSLEESGLLIRGVSETIKNEIKEQKDEVIGILLGTLDASLLGVLIVQVNAQLEQVRIFNAASSFDKF